MFVNIAFIIPLEWLSCLLHQQSC